MKEGENRHLDNEQLSRAVVDEVELSVSVREHLAQCSLCLSAKDKLEQDLSRLSRMAGCLAPSPKRPVSLTVAPATGHRPWTWRFATGPALSMVLVMLAVGWFFLRTASQERLTALTIEMWDDYYFLSEIETLAENPLPSSLQLTVEESYSAFDEDFFDFLVPDIGPQDLPNDQAKKGNWLC